MVIPILRVGIPSPLLPMPFIDQPRDIEIRQPVAAIHAREHSERDRARESLGGDLHHDIASLQQTVHGQVLDVETERGAAHGFRRILLKTSLLEDASGTQSWEAYAARYKELKATSGGRELYHLLQKGWQPIIISNSSEMAEMVTIGFRVPDTVYRLVMQNFDLSVSTRTHDLRQEMSDEEFEIEKKKNSLEQFHLKVQAELEQCFPSSLTMAFEDAKRSPIDFSSFNMALDRYGDMLRESLSPGAINRLLYYERVLFGEDLFRLEPPAVLPDEEQPIRMEPLQFEKYIEPEESREPEETPADLEAPITLSPIDL